MLVGENSNLGTREKICAGLNAVVHRWPGGSFRLITGLFDPLLACHVEFLQAACRNDAVNVVLISAGIEPLLSLKARAELVAALRCVDAVLLVDLPFEEVYECLRPQEVVRQETEHERWRAELFQRVRERHLALT